MHDARAEGDEPLRAEHERRASLLERAALAAEQHLAAAEHRATAEQWQDELDQARTATDRQAAERRRHERAEAEREERIRQRIAGRHVRGLARVRPGPGGGLAPLWAGGPGSARSAEQALDREIEVIGTALEHHGPTERQDLARMVGARYWGPGRFGSALDSAVAEGRIRRLSRREFGPADHPGSGDGSPGRHDERAHGGRADGGAHDGDEGPPGRHDGGG